MTLLQVVDAVRGALAQRFAATDDELLRWVSQAQRAAFSAPCRGFLRKSSVGAPLYSDTYDYPFPDDAREIYHVADNDCVTTTKTNYFIDPILRLARCETELPDTALFVYYVQPQDLEVETDDDLVLVPENWKYRILVTGAMHFAETENYSDQSTTQEWQTNLAQFWDEMNRWEPNRKAPVSGGAW
jgi:hypothetical protein